MWRKHIYNTAICTSSTETIHFSVKLMKYKCLWFADIWRSCASGVPSSNPALWTFPNPVPLSLPLTSCQVHTVLSRNNAKKLNKNTKGQKVLIPPGEMCTFVHLVAHLFMEACLFKSRYKKIQMVIVTFHYLFFLCWHFCHAVLNISDN